MAWTLRCRGPTGQITLPGVSPDSSVAVLQELLHGKLGVPPHRQELLAGFPPKPLQLPTDRTSAIRTLSLCNGDTFTVRAMAVNEPALPSCASSAAAAAGTAGTSTALTTSIAASAGPAAHTAAAEATHHAYMDEDGDEDLACAVAASLAEMNEAATGSPSRTPALAEGQTLQQRLEPRAPVSSGQGNVPAPTSVTLADGSGAAVVRRVIDSDNSCLFNAVGYVMEHSRSQARELRQVIARVVASDPETYNEGFLGKTNEEYCRWITSPGKWGGAIELSILCRHFAREIAAYDIQTKRVDIYGQDAGYEERTMLLYDGLHYDALAVAAFEGAPEDLDISIFSVHSEDATAIADAAAKLTEAAHTARAFTDSANFTLRCGICQIGLKGEKEAVDHAKSTGHQNFCEY